MKGVPKLFPLLLCLAALSAGAAVPTNSLVVTPPPVQIATCRKDADLNALFEDFKLSPKFIYRVMDLGSLVWLRASGLSAAPEPIHVSAVERNL